MTTNNCEEEISKFIECMQTEFDDSIKNKTKCKLQFEVSNNCIMTAYNEETNKLQLKSDSFKIVTIFSEK